MGRQAPTATNWVRERNTGVGVNCGGLDTSEQTSSPEPCPQLPAPPPSGKSGPTRPCTHSGLPGTITGSMGGHRRRTYLPSCLGDWSPKVARGLDSCELQQVLRRRGGTAGPAAQDLPGTEPVEGGGSGPRAQAYSWSLSQQQIEAKDSCLACPGSSEKPNGNTMPRAILLPESRVNTRRRLPRGHFLASPGLEWGGPRSPRGRPTGPTARGFPPESPGWEP